MTAAEELGRKVGVVAACEALEVARATLYRSGADPSLAAAVLGHSPTVALAYYRQVRDNAASSYFIR